MNIQFSNDEQLMKRSNTYSKESTTRVNLVLLQPSGFVQELAGAKHKFRNTTKGGETVVEFYAVTDKTKDTVEINSYVSDAKLTLR